MNVHRLQESLRCSGRPLHASLTWRQEKDGGKDLNVGSRPRSLIKSVIISQRARGASGGVQSNGGAQIQVDCGGPLNLSAQASRFADASCPLVRLAYLSVLRWVLSRRPGPPWESAET